MSTTRTPELPWIWPKQRAIDTETAAIGHEDVNGLAIYDPRVHAFMVSTWDSDGSGKVKRLPLKGAKRDTFGLMLWDPSYLKLFYNAPFDVPILRKQGYKVNGPVIDVCVMVQLCCPDERSYRLKDIARKYLKVSYDEDKAVKQWLKKNKTTDYSRVPDHIITPYAQRDAKYTLELFHYFWPMISEYKLWGTLQREMKITHCVMDMESLGIPVDKKRAHDLSVLAKSEARKLKAELCKMAGDPEFNPNSPKQVQKHAFRLKDPSIHPNLWPAHYSDIGYPSTDKVTMMSLDTPFSWGIIKYRQLTKATGTYLQRVLDGCDHEDRFRVTFNQNAARTGRFSSSGYGGQKFNMQNIPRQDPGLGVMGRIRECFVAPVGHWLVFNDLDQVEMRLTAHFSQDQMMLDAIRRGLDLHDETCKMLFRIGPEHENWKRYRYLAKTLNFSVIYGIQAASFRNSVLEGSLGQIRISLEQARRIIDRYHETYPGIEDLFNRLELEVISTGGVRNPYGRFLFVDDDKPYAATNYLIQSTAADYLKCAMLKIRQFIKPTDIKMLLQIHDELAFQVPYHEKGKVGTLKRMMEDHTNFDVPITCSSAVAKRWSDKHPILTAA